jgi:ribosomal protein S18 acetylase RimI-like enzyme
MFTIVPLHVQNSAALQRFFDRMPEGDRTFVQEDVTNPATVAAWLHDHRSRRLVAMERSTVVGYVAVVPGVEWESHVGFLRVLVDHEHRRQGIGRALARRGLIDAIEMGLRKVVVETSAHQESTVALFRDIGFEAEALLKNHFQAGDGQFSDLFILAHHVEENSETMAVLGLAQELS